METFTRPEGGERMMSIWEKSFLKGTAGAKALRQSKCLACPGGQCGQDQSSTGRGAGDDLEEERRSGKG